MAHTALSSRSRRLLLAPALTLAVAAPLVVTSTASACWCPTGMHESAPGSETCVTDTPPAETVAPPATTETPAPAVARRHARSPGPRPRRRGARAGAGACSRSGSRAAPTPVVTAAAPAEVPVAAGGAGRGPGRARRVQAAQEGGEEDRQDGSAAPTTAVAAAPVEATATGQLPFTGLDTGLIAVMGASMLGGGIILRRRTQPNA